MQELAEGGEAGTGGGGAECRSLGVGGNEVAVILQRAVADDGDRVIGGEILCEGETARGQDAVESGAQVMRSGGWEVGGKEGKGHDEAPLQ